MWAFKQICLQRYPKPEYRWKRVFYPYDWWIGIHHNFMADGYHIGLLFIELFISRETIWKWKQKFKRKKTC